jgi:hypothetical protein
VEAQELLASAGGDLTVAKPKPGAAKVLADDDVAALFGLEMAGTADAAADVPAGSAAAKPGRRAKQSKNRKGSVGKKPVPVKSARKKPARAPTQAPLSR